MPHASIAGTQLATVFLNFFTSLQPVRKSPASDHQTAPLSPEPATLRAADTGHRSESDSKRWPEADIAALIAGNGICGNTMGAEKPATGSSTLRPAEVSPPRGRGRGKCATSRKVRRDRGRQPLRNLPRTSRSSQKKSLPFAVDRENAVKTSNGASRTDRPSVRQILACRRSSVLQELNGAP